MPPVVAAIAFKAALIANISFVTAFTITAGILKLGFVFVANALAAKAFAPSFADRARSQTIQIKQSVTPHRILYGQRRISGPTTFIATSNNNAFLHMVITLCAHEVEAIDVVLLDNTPIYAGFINGDGSVVRGKYGVAVGGTRFGVRIQKSLGDEAAGVQPFPDLVSDTNGRWSNAHTQTGHAKIYIRFNGTSGFAHLWRSGLPNVSAIVRGKKILDNRTAATHWNVNPSVCIEDYLRTSIVNSGMGVLAADIDTTSLDAAANINDEFVETVTEQHLVDNNHPLWGGVFIDGDVLRFSGDSTLRQTFLRFETGDRVRLFNVSGVLPTGLTTGVDYYVIVLRYMRTEATEQDLREAAGTDWNIFPFPQPWPTQIQLASSYTNALKKTQIDLGGSPTGVFMVRKIAEPRYSCNYLIEVNRKPEEILTEMASAMNPIGGGISRIGGKWFFKAAAWVAPTLTFDESDTIGPIQVERSTSRNSLTNTITGLYVSPLNFDQPTTYPEITNAMYVTEDGEKLPIQIDMPATSRPATVQRLAKIILEDARQNITVRASFNLAPMQLIAGDNFTFDNTRFGWSGKFFRVVDWNLSMQDISLDDGEPQLVDVVELEFKETAEAIFDWNSGEETVIDLSNNTDLPDAFNIDAPTNIQVVESITVPTGIKAISVATMSWNASLHGFVDHYEVEYKLDADSTWIFHTTTTALTDDILDLDPGLYNFRVRALTAIGRPSPWTEHTQEMFSLSAKPGDPTNLSVIITEGQAHLTWTQSVDVDVLWGGAVEIRHDSDTGTPDWANSVGIGSGDAPGIATQTTVPLRDGHLLVKFVDSTGNKSANPATVKVLQHSAHNWSTLNTATENPTFPGTKTQVVVSGSTLELDLDGGDVFPTGTYLFPNTVDVGEVLNLRVTPTVTVISSLVNDLIDSRTGNVDDWLDWDGIEGSECDVRMEMRNTTDDPTGAPTYSAWELLDANVVTAWGLQFRTQFTSTDDEANIAASVLSVKTEERLVY